jgi:hypothetical protein
MEARADERLERGTRRLKNWRGDHPDRLKELKKLAKASDYLNNPFIARLTAKGRTI